MLRTISPFAAAATLVAAVMTVTSHAPAQESLGGYGLDQLDPAPAGDDFFGVHAPHAEGHLVPRALVLFDYAQDPLVLGTGEAIVGSQAFLHVGGSVALFDRLLLSASLPIAVAQSGDEPTVAGTTLASPDGAEVGDLRVGLRTRIAGKDMGPIQLGLGALAHFPTAGDDTFAGDGGVRVEPQLLLGGRGGYDVGVVYALNGGFVIRGSGNPASVVYRGAVGLTLWNQRLQVGPELIGATQVGDDAPLEAGPLLVAPASRTALELLVGAKARPWEGLEAGVGAGPGIADGLGTPAFRVVGSLAWAPREREERVDPDPDGDGILHPADACPDQKGLAFDDPERNGCPPPDRDGDRISDPLDACPGLAGRSSADPTRNGCPSDYDRDGVADAEDACPNQKGVSSADAKRNGCPGDVDTDLDGIADKSDACPDQKGSRNEDLSKNGCPQADGDGDGIADVDDACPNERGLADTADKAHHGCPKDVRVTTAEIVILRQIQFKFGKSSVDQTVDPLSDDLLTEVRDVILQHPEIKVIEVQGHADDQGTTEFNATLSKARAEAVRGWLVRRGVDAKRLTARGYGSTNPIASNTTEEGRQKNRRVQFVIIQTDVKEKPKAKP